MTWKDILYSDEDGIARITINRPSVYNAFSARTCDELVEALRRAGDDRSIGVVVLTGAGTKAFCTGGDLKSGEGSGYGGRGVVGLDIETLHSCIRDINVPVIARVNGYAIGGGNVLITLCDLAIAADHAQFGQVGPRVGSVDAGFGTALLARTVGEKKAREMWYLCRRYSAAEALTMGLVNAVVPYDDLDAEVAAWCAEILDKSPTAIALAKRSFNIDTEMLRAVSTLSLQALKLYYDTPESQEGTEAFREKRKPRFRDRLK